MDVAGTVVRKKSKYAAQSQPLTFTGYLPFHLMTESIEKSRHLDSAIILSAEAEMEDDKLRIDYTSAPTDDRHSHFIW